MWNKFRNSSTEKSFIFALFVLLVRLLGCSSVRRGCSARHTVAVTDAAVGTELAGADAVVLMREAATRLELAEALHKEAAQRLLLPLALGLEGAANERLLAASTEAAGEAARTSAAVAARAVSLNSTVRAGSAEATTTAGVARTAVATTATATAGLEAAGGVAPRVVASCGVARTAASVEVVTAAEAATVLLRELLAVATCICALLHVD